MLKKKNHAKDEKQIYLKYALVASFVLLMIVSLSVFISSKDDNDFNPREDSWYKVEDWEVEVCSMWGGGSESQSYSGSGIMTAATTSGFEIATIQGQKTAYRMSSNVTSYFYEVSWYYQPMVGSGSYKVYYANGDDKEIIAEGSATAQMGDGNYNAEQFKSDPGYDYVLIEYGDSFSKSIKSKIQEKVIG